MASSEKVENTGESWAWEITQNYKENGTKMIKSDIFFSKERILEFLERLELCAKRETVSRHASVLFDLLYHIPDEMEDPKEILEDWLERKTQDEYAKRTINVDISVINLFLKDAGRPDLVMRQMEADEYLAPELTKAIIIKMHEAFMKEEKER